MSLTKKQRLFISEYLKCFNATQSAIVAGYSPKTAYSAGSRLLKEPYIKDCIDDRLSELEKVLPEQVSSRVECRRSTYVYLIKADNGLIKIGIASDVNGRFINIDSMSPVPLSLLFSFYNEDALRVERKLHKRFAAKRVKGEWFNLSRNEIDWIIGKYGDGINDTIESVEPIIIQLSILLE